MLCNKKEKIFRILKLMLGVSVLAFILYTLNVHGLGIPCIFKVLTGFSCPGCGATRMSVCFIHGQIKRGFYYNQIFPFILPILGIIYLKNMPKYLREDRFTLTKFDKYICIILICILYIYAIVRNLPFYPWKI